MQQTSSKMIWILIVLIVVVAGGFLYYRMQTAQAPSATEEGYQDAGAAAAGTADVEAELNGMDLESLDADTAAIEQEIAK